MENKHLYLKNQVSDITFNILEDLFKFISKDDYELNKNIDDYVFSKLNWKKEKNADSNVKSKIMYNRYCSLIEHILKEYSNLSGLEKKEMIDYYLWDNGLKEIKCIGLSWYYDYKFKKNTATIYKGRYKETNWSEIRNSTLNNETGVEAVKGIMRTCREHINKGGNVELRSFSKCFATDLFKYISLYEHVDKSISADIYIKRDAEINVVKTFDKGLVSLQQFIYKNLSIDDCDFVIDFSTPRDNERKNFDKWYEEFMTTKFGSINSDEFESKSLNDYLYDFLVRKQENDTKISKMVSPLTDEEVIVSGDLWGGCIEFNEEGSACYDDIDKLKYVHFNLNENELYKLIYTYYEKYSEKNEGISPNDFEFEYNNYFESLINELHKYNESNNVDNLEEVFKKLNYIREESKKGSKKIETLLKLIDWSNEKINTKWDFRNIYNKKNENLYVNFFKLILIDTYKKSRMKGIHNYAEQ
ncbi:hypothetical protein [Clostridium butyricum]|uniref:hypothetical protein n=1 Tax=Clostridium butyricum TaxID=1492 RepID=UPI00054402A3|nr:hypothetical protein [Clostridium butyricum]KHD14000.1 hypothetical protein OA81_17915 [Clostridium butyricum]